MCVSKGAPSKPAYGPCNEAHGFDGRTFAAVMHLMVTMLPLLEAMESVMKAQTKEAAACA